MKRIPAIMMIFVLLVWAVPAYATTLEEALAETLARNPTYITARDNYQANYSSQFITFGAMLPSVTAFATETRADTDAENYRTGSAITSGTSRFNVGKTDTDSYGVELEQILFASGKNINAYLGKKAEVRGAGYRLVETEQQIFLAAITAYLDVIQAQSVLELNQSNVAVLQKQFQAVKDRFEVGVVTRTDVAQSEAGLANARAGLLMAEADLQSSRAIYREVVGIAPQDLQRPASLPTTPPTLEDALGIARRENPSLQASKEDASNANYSFYSAIGDALPNVRLTGRYVYTEDPSGIAGIETETTSVMVRLNVPLIRGGRTIAGIEAARYAASAVRSGVHTAANTAERGVIAAWSNYQATTAAIRARKQQIKASDIALDGVREENKLGTRTVLNVLDAEQNFLDARVALVRAERNQFVAAYALLASVGRLTGRALGIAPADVDLARSTPAGLDPTYPDEE